MADTRTFLSTHHGRFLRRSPNNQLPPFPPLTDKTKHLKKKTVKCHDPCKRHMLSIRKIGQIPQGFSVAKMGVQHNFCPEHNKLIGIEEGGLPSFNADRRIDTPSFILTSEKTNSVEMFSKIRSWQFRQDLAKATNSTEECSKQPLYLKKGQPFKEIKDSSLNIIIEEFMQILKKKESGLS